jgi:hypothetical protein
MDAAPDFSLACFFESHIYSGLDIVPRCCGNVEMMGRRNPAFIYFR